MSDEKEVSIDNEEVVEVVEELVVEEDDNKKYDELMDKYMRSLADFDNFRKRTQKEKSSMYANGVSDVVQKILPIMDNLERALLSVSNKDDSLYKGVDMIFKQFTETLTSLGVTAIDAVDEQFDANVHYAVQHVEDEKYGTNIVIEQLQRGYKLNDKVIRPSMVKVAN